MHTPPSVRRILRHRVAAVALSVFTAGLIVGVTGSATAAPTPTVKQVQAKLTKLQDQQSKLDQQYDQVKQELASTNQRLALVNKEIAAYSRRFDGMRQQIASIAVAAYEDDNLNSTVTLLTAGNPQQILNQSSILLELSAADDAQISQFLATARELSNAQALAKRTKIGIVELQDSLAKRRAAMNKMVSSEQTLLSQLTPAEQTGLSAGGGQTGGIKYTGPTSTQAEKAVAFAYDQLGCPYVYGGTGPCADGFDCSGLTMEAWASAGVTIPRTSYDQIADLPAVDLPSSDPEEYLEPGDILGFIGNAHVGIYVGDGNLIDAPQTGEDVELVPLSGWYLTNLDAAVRP